MNLEDAEILAKLYIEQHLSNQDNGQWKFEWNDRKRTYGVCDYRRKTIYLSRFLTPGSDEKDVEDTILHEIAHALTPGSRHGRLWKIMARHLGANPYSTRKMDDDHKEEVENHYKWVMVLRGAEGKIIRGYYRKPNVNTFDTLHLRYIRGRKNETKGKLEIIPFETYKSVYGNES